MLTAFLPQQLHQLFTAGTVDNVLISVGVDIALFQSGEVFVQLLVKVFTVTVAQCRKRRLRYSNLKYRRD